MDIDKKITVIDGSEGEGGGQILRTALTLSALTEKPFRIKNIRSKRSKPGLLRQHLTALKATAQICNAKYSKNVGVGTKAFEFFPGKITAGNFNFAVGTAGNTMLVLQTILLPLLNVREPSNITISGGTHNPASPPFEFIMNVYLPILQKMGVDVELEIQDYGFAPAGGGKIIAKIAPCISLRPINILERGEQQDLYVESYFANIPVAIAKRELAIVGDQLDLPDKARFIRGVKSIGPGNAVMVTVCSENITEVFTTYGRRGVRAESVAEEAIALAKNYMKSAVAVDSFLADQLLLPFALAGGGAFTTTRPTQHTLTNAKIISKFLPVSITFTQLEDPHITKVDIKSN